MKTFNDYLNMKEMAAYSADEQKPKGSMELDDRSQASISAMKEALGEIMNTRPDMLVAFLNLHRTEADIKKILLKHKMDVFVDPKMKSCQHFKEKGLADEEGRGNMVHPSSADGYAAHGAS